MTTDPDLKDLPLTKVNIARRLSISMARDTILFDGEPIGTLSRQSLNEQVMGTPRTKTDWVATITLNGEEATVQNSSFSGLSDRLSVVITGVLRRQEPAADHGPLVLQVTPDEFDAIQRNRRGVIRAPYARKFSRASCRAGRHIVLLNGDGRGAGNRLEGAVVSVEYVQPPRRKRHALVTVAASSIPEPKETAVAKVPALPPETQRDVCVWAEASFSDRSPAQLVARALQEFSDLTIATISRMPSAQVAEEAADVAILLCEVGQLVGVVDLIAAPPSVHARKATACERLIMAGRMLLTLLNEASLLDNPTAANREHPVTRTMRGAVEQVASALAAICEAAGTTLSSAVASKMHVNRQRVWNRDGSYVRAA